MNVVAPADAESVSAREKKRHVGAQARSQPTQLLFGHTRARQPQQAEEGRRGVARAASQAALDRNVFFELHLDAAPQAQPAPRPRQQAVNQVGPPRRGAAAGHAHDDFTAAGQAQPQAVVQADRLVTRADFAVAVGAPAEELQAQVDLGEGGQQQPGGGHHRQPQLTAELSSNLPGRGDS
ncbi:MAG: hypothetical protein A3B65_07180 [Acidobacteria bacterium RIFCSPHIGHO2_02_FULL_67_57]|nr:MAG: hypothetical protein A3B65_07180 [Acidobacteria bacterium RIFCSPHIGHO2_02_FULL_67_57]